MLYSLYFMMYLLCISPVSDAPVTAEESNLSGSWYGELTQNEGSYRSSYEIYLIISEKDGIVSGYSYVSVDDIYASMSIEGTLSNNILMNAKDISIIETEQNAGMEWCMRNYSLILKKDNNVWKLEGHWNGSTSFSTCTPGKIYLKKAIPRA